MSADEYYRGGDRPHERHHDAPPYRDESRSNDYYDGDRSRSKSRDRRNSGGDKDRDIAGTLIGGAAGAFGGHALGAKGGHGVIGTVLGGVAGAFVGHKTEEKVDDWRDERKDKKEEEERRRRDEERRREDERRRSRSRSHGRRSRSRSRSSSRHHHHHDRGHHGDPETVVVQQGDTLRGIAARFNGVSFEEIARFNNIANPDTIYPGQTLAIPRR